MEDSGSSKDSKELNDSQDTDPSTVATDVEALKMETDDQEKIEQAEEFKKQGNEAFQDSRYQEAYDLYTKAADLCVGGKKQAVYFSNRAFASIRLENYGIAVVDAKAALDIDPKFVKAYYRRGSALFALGKYKESVRDFLKVCKMFPKSKEARTKYAVAKKAKVEMEFASCIAVEEVKIEIDPEDIIVEESYNGPVITSREDINVEWVLALMQHFKEEKKLHKKYVVMLINFLMDSTKEQDALVDIEVPEDGDITICGDTHGQYYDLMNIFEKNGYPSETNPYLYNGDFVDRGSFSVEVMLTLIAWKIVFPNHVHLTRGNHETKNMNKMYGFEGEVKAKYDMKLMELFSYSFWYLPL
mmetsp:Transcript_1260/g.1215  ORF Transcript_1260/g.1215 Transcript_1260/m.1215 type:complete len:357 (+) Transcript_1260:18-1088(+)